MHERNKASIQGTDVLLKSTSKNTQTLIAQQGITPAQLAKMIDMDEVTISSYMDGTSIPSTEFLWKIKQLYGISIDDFLTKELDDNHITDFSVSSSYEQAELKIYSKYTGTYYVYYFDTSKYKGRDYNSDEESIMYGIIRIYNEHNEASPLNHRCVAVLGIHDREKARDIKETIESFDDVTQLNDLFSYVNGNFPDNVYYGDFDMTPSHAFISLQHENKDRALIILYRAPLSSQNYIGGLGTINSISKGRESMPTVQFIGLTRYRLYLSEEEIHYNLLLNYPTFKATDQAKKLIQTFKQLYLKSNEADSLSEEYKAMIIKNQLERDIRDIMQKNMFRYGKISNRDDDEWYHTLKKVIIRDDNLGNA